MAEFLAGLKVGTVAALPAAASNDGVQLRQGGKLWLSDGTAWVDITGNAFGPASAVDNRIARFNGTTGKLLRDGGTDLALVQGMFGVQSTVASAAATNIGAAATANIVVTGTATITSFTTPTGALYFIRFAGVMTLTQGASLTLPGSASITTAAGDWAIAWASAANTVQFLSFQRASGLPAVTGLTDILLSQQLI